MKLVSRGSEEHEYQFPAGEIAPGQIVSVSEAELGFRPSDDEFVGLYDKDGGSLFDARRVTGRLLGLAPGHGGDWLYPSRATPGAENEFQFNDDIVINEIMYHAPPNLAVPDTPQH